jgi:DNA-binding MarR family transcriptional regulator
MFSILTDVTLNKLYAKPGHLIRRCQQIAVALFIEEANAGGFDVTPVQYAALAAIAAHPGVEATTLSAQIALDRSTLGDVVERLVGKGLVERAPDPQDRRVKRLAVTREGARLLAAIEPAVERAQTRILAPLGAADRKRFLALLEQLVDINNHHSRAPRRAIAE